MQRVIEIVITRSYGDELRSASAESAGDVATLFIR